MTIPANVAAGSYYLNAYIRNDVGPTQAGFPFSNNMAFSRTKIQIGAATNYTISASVSPASSGTITGTGTFASGTSATLTATAATGYQFVNWTEGGSAVSTNAAYTFTVSGNRTLVANFVATYVIAASVSPSNSGTITGAGTFASGATATLTATAATGYQFVNWTQGGSAVSTSAQYAFTVTAARTFVANFVATYAIAATVSPANSGSITGTGTFASGATATLTATAATGYQFVNWTQSGSVVSTSAQYAFTVTAARTLVANFVATYAIAATVSPSNSGTVTGAGTFAAGATATLAATASTGYQFLNWTENGSVVSTQAQFAFTVTAARTLVANFVATYVISATVSPASSGSVTGTGTFASGSSVTLTATAATGYQFVNWTQSGSSVSTAAQYTFTVSTNRAVVANFAASAQSPAITALSQNVAPYYGGEFPLVVTGTNFGSGAVVSIGSSALVTTFNSATQLTAQVTTPVLSSLGTFDVKVTNADTRTSNTMPMKVIVRGDTNGNGSVNIGDALNCALTAGLVNKPLFSTAVGDLNLSGAFNIGDCLVVALFSGRLNGNLNVPVITSVSPSTAIRGSALTITGSGFSATAAENQVLFSTGGGSVTRVTPSAAATTTLTVTVPNDAVSGPAQVYRLDSPLGGAEFPLFVSGTTTPLALTGMSPYFAVAPGSSVTLNGMGFDSTAANNTVLFKSAGGSVGANVTSASPTSLTVNVPAQAVCGPVTVGVAGQTSNSRMITIIGTSCGVQLGDLWGGSGAGETLVMEGAGFDVSATANNVVKFSASGGGTVNAPVLAAGGTQLHVRVPDTATQGNVTVTVGAATSNPATYNLPSTMTPASIDVVINTTKAVGSYQITIAYDKNIVRLDAANVRGGNGAGFTSAPTTINIDNVTGTVTLNQFQTGNAPTGQFTVANLTFTPVSVGTSTLTVSGRVLTDTQTSDIDVNQMTLSSPTVRVLRVP